MPEVYCKMRHTFRSASEIAKCDINLLNLLQSASGVTKCDRLSLHSASGIKKCDRPLLQSPSVITKCDSYYNVRP